MSASIDVSADQREKLRVAYRLLEELSGHDLPVIRFNCRKAKNELWQALFELDLLPDEPSDGHSDP
jgi:prephenate dehydratase